jgi:Ca2+-binding RTX toxin-like protein
MACRNGLGGRGVLDGGGPDLICGGNDTMSGGAGNDRLFGKAGIDRLTGGTGAHFFSGKTGTDVATDFSSTQGDTKDNTTP